jgi:alpha-1,3-rhamnosyltransferase
MIEQPLISIVIACYKPNHYLDLMVESVIKQSYKNIEIVISDGGSDPSFYDKLRDYQELDSRIKLLLSDEYVGIVGSLTKALEVIKGSFFILLHHDDILPINYVESMSSYMDDSTAVVFTSDDLIDQNGKVFYPANRFNTFKYLIPDAYLSVDNISTIGIMINTNVSKKLGLFYRNYVQGDNGNLKGFDEWRTWVDLSTYGRVVYNPNVVSKYRQHPGNVRNYIESIADYEFLSGNSHTKKMALHNIFRKYSLFAIPILIFYLSPLILLKLLRKNGIRGK